MWGMVNYGPSSLGIERTRVRVHEHEHIRLPAGMDGMDWPQYLIEITLRGIDRPPCHNTHIYDPRIRLHYCPTQSSESCSDVRNAALQLSTDSFCHAQ